MYVQMCCVCVAIRDFWERQMRHRSYRDNQYVIVSIIMFCFTTHNQYIISVSYAFTQIYKYYIQMYTSTNNNIIISKTHIIHIYNLYRFELDLYQHIRNQSIGIHMYTVVRYIS